MLGLYRGKTYKALFAGSTRYRVLSQIFRLVGFDILMEENDQKLISKLSNLLETKLDEYALIIMPEEYVEPTKKLRDKVREQGHSIPVFLFLPDIRNPKYLQLAELNEMLRRALGISLPEGQS